MLRTGALILGVTLALVGCAKEPQPSFPTTQPATPLPTRASATPRSTSTQTQIADYPWKQRFADAQRYAESRPGAVGIAVVDEEGRPHEGTNARIQVSSASVIKSMLLVAYLRQDDVRNRDLTAQEKAILGPMIHISDDDAATNIFNRVGEAALIEVADQAGMKDFVPDSRWGLSQMTPADMAQYFYKIDKLIPKPHRQYAMDLLGNITKQQQWGIPPGAPPGWATYIKGGWIDGVVNQIGLLTKDGRRFSLAVMIEGTPDTEAGVQNHPEEAVGPQTITGVTKRLLKDYNDYAQ